MSALRCPGCGARASEFDPRCPACGIPLATVPALPLTDLQSGPRSGQTVSHFRIVNELGRGGMGVVYRAFDLELQREVALKFLAPRPEEGPSSALRLRREALAAAALDHPNIGTIHEIGEHQGRPFLALALYTGETLAARLRRRDGAGLPVAEAGSIAAQLAAALAAAHHAGIVHRDLKPTNVFLTRDERVKLLDFGLARQGGETPLTSEGIAVGTAAYMPPERLLGGEGGGSSDLWALGVLLYEMLAGRLPFAAVGTGGPGAMGRAPQGLIEAILQSTPAPLRPGGAPEGSAEIPPDLERLVLRLLEKDPGRRLASADELVAELKRLGFGSDSSGGTGVAIAGASLPPRRRPWVAVASGAGLAVAVGLLVLLALRLRRPELPPLAVAVTPTRILPAGGTETGALLAANVATASLRTLGTLAGVIPLDPSQVGAVEGTVLDQARAVAAQEVVTSSAECAGSLCQLTLRRLRGDSGQVLWTQTLQVSPAAALLTAEAVGSALRQGYREREPIRPSTPQDRGELGDVSEVGEVGEVGEEAYARYLGLVEDLDRRRRPLPAILADLEALQRQAPRFLDAYTLAASLSAELLETSGDGQMLERGLRSARQARDLAPGDPRPLAALFDLLLAAHRPKEAAPILHDLERVAVTAPDLLLRRARLAESQGDLAGAAAQLERLVAQRPSWPYLLDLALLESRQGRLATSRGHLEALLRRYPGQRQGLATLASLELLQGDPERAVVLFRDLDRRAPDFGSASNLGLSLLLVRRPVEAEAPLRRALALAPANAVAELNLADALLLQRRPAEAMPLYRRAASRVEPPSRSTPQGWLSVGAQALAHLGERRRSVELIQGALRAAPDDAQVAFEASLVYTLVGDRSSALVLAERALRSGVAKRWFDFPWFDPLRSDLDALPFTPAGSSDAG